MRPGIFVLLLFSIASCFSQEADSVRMSGKKIVDTLASPYMSGRGYLNNGSSKAASYIEESMKRYGLHPLFSSRSSYYHQFTFPVNTITKAEVGLFFGKEEIRLKPVSEFLTDPACSSVKLKADYFLFDSSNVSQFNSGNKRFRKKILVFDTAGMSKKSREDLVIQAEKNYGQAAVIWLVKPAENDGNKRVGMWGVSTLQLKPAVITLSRDSFYSKGKPSKISLDISAKEKETREKNIAGYVEGEVKDSFIVFTAHYDHLGMMGDAIFYGANDNASGTAMMLTLAKHYSLLKEKPKYSVLFIAFAAEEAGLIGSSFFTAHSPINLGTIKFLINMDIMGTGDEGITVVNSTAFKKEFQELERLNAQKSLLARVKSRGQTMNSDHYPFSAKGVPAFFIYTMGGIKSYHDIYDKRETLPLTKFTEVFILLTDFVSWLETTR